MAEDVKILQLRHLARELLSALELALVGRASNAIVEQLASATGLLIALEELPLETEALRIWASEAVPRAERSLANWRAWQATTKTIA